MPLPYTPNPGNVKRFLEHVRGAGVPSKVSQNYLESVGFRSKNDRYIIGVLKQIGFVDETGSPTERWRQYRDKAQGPAILAKCLRACYSGLFEAYPDAYTRDTETLRNYMSANSDSAEVTVGRMVGTFRTLASLANFDDTVQVGGAVAPGAPTNQDSTSFSAAAPGQPLRVLPPDDGMEQFVSDGILIRINPTPENVRRAIKFLRIYSDENEQSGS